LNDLREPNKIDTVASEACTRSGAFALLLSVVLLLLIPYWSNRRNHVALAEYVVDRLNLVNAVDSLADMPTWQKYKATHENAEAMSIAELMKASVEVVSIDTSGPFIHIYPPSQPPTQDIKGVPSAPTNLRASMQSSIDYIPQIAKELNGLNRSDLLSRSRQVSTFFDNSVSRWATKRINLIYLSYLSKGCTNSVDIQEPGPKKLPDYFVQEVKKDVMLECLSIRSVEELARYELPILTNSTQLGGAVGPEIALSPGSLPRDPYMASVVVQLLLFFVLIHFGSYAREAISSEGFPAPGTLFSAFSRSKGTLLVMLCALWCPFLAALAVTVTSRKWSLVPYTVLVASAVLFAHLTLQRKSYFSVLNPRRVRTASMQPVP